MVNGGQLLSATFGKGDAGDIILNIDETALFDGVDPFVHVFPSSAASSIEPGGEGTAGDVLVNARNLEIVNGAQIDSATDGIGDAGNVILIVDENLRIGGETTSTGSTSAVFSGSRDNGTGSGGDIRITSTSLQFENGSLSAASLTEDAGNIILSVEDIISLAEGRIETSSFSASGGEVKIKARGIQLEENSDISTFVIQGDGGGGNITVQADYAIALDDSDILAFAADGRGGDINFRETAFFGQNYQPVDVAILRTELGDYAPEFTQA